jgi:hypothetical protein
LHLGRYRAFDGGQRGFRRRGLGTARLSQVGSAAAALATQCFGPETNQFDGIETRGQIWGDANDNGRLSVGARDHRYDTGIYSALQIVGQRLELASWDAVDQPSLESDLTNPFLGGFGAGAGACQRSAGLGNLAFQPPTLLDNPNDPRR